MGLECAKCCVLLCSFCFFLKINLFLLSGLTIKNLQFFLLIKNYLRKNLKNSLYLYEKIFQEYFEPCDKSDRLFDSSDYRCCFSMLHAKIGTFIFCTWIFHEIVLGGIFLTTQIGLIDTPLLLFLTFCRLTQFLTTTLVYYALWKQKAILLIPFAVVQVSL